MKKEETLVENTEEAIVIEETTMDEYGVIIKPIGEIITTKQPEAETAEETVEE